MSLPEAVVSENTPGSLLQNLLNFYEPGITNTAELNSIRALFPLVSGDKPVNGMHLVFAVDPSVDELNQMTKNIAQAVGNDERLFVFVHVSERSLFKGNPQTEYDELMRMWLTTDPNSTSLLDIVEANKKTPVEMAEYLSALKQLTGVLCDRLACWEHIFLVLPFETWKDSFGPRFLTLGQGLGEASAKQSDVVLHTGYLKTLCLNITPAVVLPGDVIWDTTEKVDLSKRRDVMRTIFKAPESKNLQNVFLEFMLSFEIIRSSASQAGGDITQAPSQDLGPSAVLAEPLGYLTFNPLKYLHITKCCPPILVYRVLALQPEVEHVIVTMEGPLPLQEFKRDEQHAILRLTKLRVLHMTLLSFPEVREEDVRTANLLDIMDLSGLEKLTMVFPTPQYLTGKKSGEKLEIRETGTGRETKSKSELERSNSFDPKELRGSLERTVCDAMQRCSLRIEHSDAVLVKNLEAELATREKGGKWSQVKLKWLKPIVVEGSDSETV